MIQIDNAIISFDVFEKFFLCDLMACKGACCVEGVSGAPVTMEEVVLIKKYYPLFEQYLPDEHRKVIHEEGFSIIDNDGDLVTPLYNESACAYTYADENGITKCAIEKAFLEGKIDFRKPISCHLFPIRITEHPNFDAVNYQRLHICKAARDCGIRNKLPLYKFLKDPLIRKYGEDWYHELEVAAEYVKDLSR
ncbi:MAG TPA: DUF3109 family protein [Prolixibacteraceae bacterium]|nr:DUF3109 family protein [Prolixibacteraceae bacterium]